MKHLRLLVAATLALLPTLAFADPVSAVVSIGSMAASWGGASGLVGAVTAGAGVTGSMVAAGMSFAGATLSLVGNATKNKKLMDLGNIAAVAGAAGSLALGATAPSSAEVAKETAKKAAQAASPASEAAAAVTAEAVGNAAPAVAEAADAVQAANSAASAPMSHEAWRASELRSSGLVNRAAAPSSSPILDAIKNASTKTSAFLRENKELVKIGSEAIKGALSKEQSPASATAAADAARREAYNAGIINSQGGFPLRIDPNVQVTQVSVASPNRYVPLRGLVNSYTGA
jgi:hypothetical protein